MECLIVICIVLFLFFILNKLLKYTNWYKNIYVYTTQFTSTSEIEERLDVVNLGSNPARFGFFYEDINGENWSTGTQGFDFDYEVIKAYKKNLKDGAYVLLPIVQFSSVSGYLLDKPHKAKFYSRFSKILTNSQIKKSWKLKRGKMFLLFPLLFEPFAIIRLICDTQMNKNLEVSSNIMQKNQLFSDAHKWMKIWKDEFNIKDFDEELSDELLEGRKKSVELMLRLVTFLRKENYKPVIISLPMSVELGKLFNEKLREKFVYSFIREIQNKIDVVYLDYMNSSELSDNKNFYNSLFMNLEGRKKFTKIVLKDLGIQ